MGGNKDKNKPKSHNKSFDSKYSEYDDENILTINSKNSKTISSASKKVWNKAWVNASPSKSEGPTLKMEEEPTKNDKTVSKVTTRSESAA